MWTLRELIPSFYSFDHTLYGFAFKHMFNKNKFKDGDASYHWGLCHGYTILEKYNTDRTLYVYVHVYMFVHMCIHTNI